jgi:RNA polymerase sigma-70 factor (ECF subfamily)
LAYGALNRETVEDLTQSTFERALRAYSRFDPRRASESTWLLAIARNLLIDHHRRDRHGTSLPIDEAVAGSVPGPEGRYEGSAELAAALAQLGDRDREVIALRYGGDLKGPEVAELLGITLANVQQILSRSLRKLRSTLEGGESALSGRQSGC